MENNKKANRKSFILIFLTSSIISFMTAPLRGGYVTVFGLTGLFLSALVAPVVLFFLTYFFLKKYSPSIKAYQILITILIATTFYEWPIRIIEFKSTLASIPDFIIRLFGIFLAYSVFKTKNILKYLIAILGFVFIFVSATVGYPMVLHKLSYGSYTGKLESKENLRDIQINNNEGDSLTLNTFRGKYVLIDCWSTTCGICYKEMPETQALYEEYQHSDNIEVIALHFRMETETCSKGTEILESQGYTFPCYSFNMESLKELGVKGFPTYIILNKDGGLLFKGELKLAKEYLKELL